MEQVHAVYQPPRREGIGWRSSVLVSGLDGTEQEVWIESTVEQPVSADPFALLLVPVCLTRGVSLHIDGPVSASLWRNLYEFSWAFYTTGAHRGDPTATPPLMTATTVPDASPSVAGGTAIVAFSGGVDSSFSIMQHTRNLPKEYRYELARAVMVHGFDVSVANENGFRALVDRVRVIPEQAGVELVFAATNFRDLRPDWEMSYGAAVAAILHACRGDSSFGLIPSSVTYGNPIIPWGSGPHLDHLFSSDSLRAVADGSALTRYDKVAALVDWPDIIPSLKFCWQGSDRSVNCGKCPKCVLTWIYLQLCGSTECPFAAPLSERDVLASIRRMRVTVGVQWTFGIAVAKADQLGTKAPWVEVARKKINPTRRAKLLATVTDRARQTVARLNRALRRMR